MQRPSSTRGVAQSDVAARTLHAIEEHAIVSLDKMQQLVASTTAEAERVELREIVDQMDCHRNQQRNEQAIRQSRNLAGA